MLKPKKNKGDKPPTKQASNEEYPCTADTKSQVEWEVQPPGSPVLLDKITVTPLDPEQKAPPNKHIGESKSFNLDEEKVKGKKRRASISNANDIFSKIASLSAKLTNSFRTEKDRTSSKISETDSDELNSELAEIHKYVEHKSNVLKSEAYYCTPHGKIKGMLTIKDTIIVFDPLKCSENQKYNDLSRYHWFIDLSDICDVQILKLPNESAQYIHCEKDRQWYIHDYYLQISICLYGEDERQWNLLKEKVATALAFFRFSHRDMHNNPLTNKQQAAIVDNIYQNILYLADNMTPHVISSTKVPFYDPLLDEHAASIVYTEDCLKKRARAYDHIHVKMNKDDDSIIEEKPSPLKLAPNMLSMSIPTFSPFRSGDDSCIISETQAIMIGRLLPSMVRMREWQRLFSIDIDGISLNTFYNNLHDHSSTIIVMQDINGWKFGWYASQEWSPHKHFYGTGESFLFSFEETEEQLKTYRWSGENDNIQYSDNNSIAMGGDRGKFALYLRNNFYHGSSRMCSTFNNSVLSSEEDFECVKFEVWGFEYY